APDGCRSTKYPAPVTHQVAVPAFVVDFAAIELLCVSIDAQSASFEHDHVETAVDQFASKRCARGTRSHDGDVTSELGPRGDLTGVFDHEKMTDSSCRTVSDGSGGAARLFRSFPRCASRVVAKRTALKPEW